MNANITTTTSVEKICQLLKAIDQPARINILLTIGSGEACVCHLEAILGLRQAYISQHLMALRDGDILSSRREGRYIFYSLADERMLELIQAAGEIAGIPLDDIDWQDHQAASSCCPCPLCASETELMGNYQD